MKIKARNLKGYLQNGTQYKVRLVHRTNENKDRVLFAELYCFCENSEQWIYQTNECEMYNQFNYVEKLRSVLTRCEKEWGIELLKVDLKVA